MPTLDKHIINLSTMDCFSIDKKRADAFVLAGFPAGFPAGIITYSIDAASATYPVSNAFDGDENTFASTTDNASYPYPHWIKVDLGIDNSKIYRKARWKVRNSYGTPKDIKWQGSNDDASWTDLYSGTSVDTTNWQEVTWSNSTSYRYYRIYSSSGYAKTYNYLMQIYEIVLSETV